MWQALEAQHTRLWLPGACLTRAAVSAPALRLCLHCMGASTAVLLPIPRPVKVQGSTCRAQQSPCAVCHASQAIMQRPPGFILCLQAYGAGSFYPGMPGGRFEPPPGTHFRGARADDRSSPVDRRDPRGSGRDPRGGGGGYGPPHSGGRGPPAGLGLNSAAAPYQPGPHQQPPWAAPQYGAPAPGVQGFGSYGGGAPPQYQQAPSHYPPSHAPTPGYGAPAAGGYGPPHGHLRADPAYSNPYAPLRRDPRQR